MKMFIKCIISYYTVHLHGDLVNTCMLGKFFEVFWSYTRVLGG